MIVWRIPCLLKADGYSYVAEQVSTRLSRELDMQDAIEFCDLNVDIPKDIPISGINIGYSANFAPDSEILINNCLPEDYVFNANYVIGFSFWESDELPFEWIEPMNRCNEIWTTSKWAVDVFKKSGVNVPIYNFNLGIDTFTFKPIKRENHGNPFTFLHIGSPATRKNTQLVVDAFLELFKDNTEYKLIIKSKGPPDARIYVNGDMVGGVYGVSNIEVIDTFITDKELYDLYNRVDCFIYPTMGEGWGLSPFMAIATGLPTICTNATACTEFAGLSVPLEAETGPVHGAEARKAGYWANPKLEQVCDKINYVIENYKEVCDKTYNSALYIHNNYNWDTVVESFKKRLCEIQKING